MMGSNFVFSVPEFVSKCERRALMDFFQEYFTALEDCEEISDEEVLERKQIIMKRLQDTYKSLKKHRETYTPVMRAIHSTNLKQS